MNTENMKSSGYERLRLNLPAFFFLIIYPIILGIFAYLYLQNHSFGLFEISMLLIGHYCTNISIGVAMHRLWSHNAFKVKKWVEWVFAFLTAGALQSPGLVWCSDHQRHHTYTDTDLDPHSPLKYENKVLGFLWAHIGWMLFRNSFQIDRMTMKRLGKPGSPLLFQLKHYYKLAFLMNVIVPLCLGYLLTFSISGAVSAYIFLGLGRTFQQHMTFCVNSVCHFLGSRKYVDGTSGDIWWMFFLLLGENWHNFHHAFARDYRNGWKWYHADVHKWIIYAMYKLGLVSDLVVTPISRIQAKEVEAKSQMLVRLQENLKLIEATAQKIADAARQRASIAEKSAQDLAANVYTKLQFIEYSAQQLVNKVHVYASEINLTEELVSRANKKLRSIEKLAKRFGIYAKGHITAAS